MAGPHSARGYRPRSQAECGHAGRVHSVCRASPLVGERSVDQRHDPPMTLREKVGQLFVAKVYGESADTTSPDDVAANQAMYGPRHQRRRADRHSTSSAGSSTSAGRTTPAIRSRSPTCPTASSGPRSTAARACPMLISTDQEHGIVCRVGEPATLFPGAMALGAGAPSADARSVGRSRGGSCRARHPAELRPRRRRQRQPANPVIGVRSFGAEPERGRRAAAAEVARVPGRRRRRDRQALPRARRHRRRTATAASRSSPTAAAVGAARRAAVPGRASPPASTRS